MRLCDLCNKEILESEKWKGPNFFIDYHVEVNAGSNQSFYFRELNFHPDCLPSFVEKLNGFLDGLKQKDQSIVAAVGWPPGKGEFNKTMKGKSPLTEDILDTLLKFFEENHEGYYLLLDGKDAVPSDVRDAFQKGKRLTLALYYDEGYRVIEFLT